jgi:hypothetical protein
MSAAHPTYPHWYCHGSRSTPPWRAGGWAAS